MKHHRPSATTRRPSRRLLATGVVLAGAASLGAAAWLATDDSPTPTPSVAAPSTPAPTPTAAPTPAPSPEPAPEPAIFTILAGGDVLPHEWVHISARTDAGYDFTPQLAGIDAWVSAADLALCHLEVPFTPDGQKVSGYPMFGASPMLADDLLDQGWDGCSTASNHSVDRAWAGVETTLDRLDDVGLGHVGTARSAEEAASAQLYDVDVDGQVTRVAHLAATYGLNGLPMPAAQPWAVQLIDVDQVLEQARVAREEGADLVVVSVHAGNEYQPSPTDQQVEVAEALAASGVVDLMIGHHAHVPQPFDLLDGGPDGSGMWAAYGLGNMISNQDSECCVPQTDSGLLLTASVEHTPGAPARVTGVEWTAVTVDRKDAHRMHVLAEIPDGAGTLASGAVADRYERVREVVAGSAPERTRPPRGTATVTVLPRGDARN